MKSGCGPIPSGKTIADVCTEEQFQKLSSTVSQEVLLYGDKEAIAKSGCIPPCTIQSYKFSPPVIKTKYEEMTGPQDKNRIKLVLGTTRPSIEVKEEIFVYDRNNLLADIGGFTGMLLGASCLTLFDEIVGLIEWLRKAYFGKLCKK